MVNPFKGNMCFCSNMVHIMGWSQKSLYIHFAPITNHNFTKQQTVWTSLRNSPSRLVCWMRLTTHGFEAVCTERLPGVMCCIYRCLIPIPSMGLVYLPTLTWMVDLYGTCREIYQSHGCCGDMFIVHMQNSNTFIKSNLYTCGATQYSGILFEYWCLYTKTGIGNAILAPYQNMFLLMLYIHTSLLVMLSLPVVPVTILFASF